MAKKCIWIAWESQRRTIELSKVFGCNLYIFDKKIKYRFLRYSLGTIFTILKLLKSRPKIVFCQNPSIVLSTLLCFLKKIFRFKLVVDRHSNFMLSRKDDYLKKIFLKLSNFTIKNADITIVTNIKIVHDLIDYKEKDKVFVLPDKLPDISSKFKMIFDNKKINLLFITSFGRDEPISEYLSAVEHCDDKFHTFVTGNHLKYPYQLKDSSKVTFTGFVDDDFYRTLLNAVDIVVVLTKHDYTLTCGAYEAVSAGKPMILSNFTIIKEYFHSGAVYSDCSVNSIRQAIYDCYEDLDRLAHEVSFLKKQLGADWEASFRYLKGQVKNI